MSGARWRQWVAVLTGIAPSLMMGAFTSAQAQTEASANSAPAGAPSVRVSPVIVAEPEVETALSIVVGPELALPRQTFIRIKGLPQAARLSDGHVVQPGIWAVPLAALPSLRLIAPLSSSGRSDLTLSLVTVDGNILSEVRSSLVVAPSWLLSSSAARGDKSTSGPASGPPSAPAAGKPAEAALPQKAASLPPQPTPPAASQAQTTPPQPATAQAPATPAPLPQQVAPPIPAQAPVVAALPPARVPDNTVRAPAPQPASPSPAAIPKTPPMSPADRARAEAMIQRGDAFMTQGNLAAARQFFRRAADMGHGLGAMRLGATFDPFELSGVQIVGIDPDPKEAASWYERARELGITDASQRLGRLQNRR